MADEIGSRIAVDQLTEAAFSGVLAALKKNDVPASKFPGPILVGIIAWPELSQFREQAGGNIPGATQ
jgi:hypothetical protein